VEKSNLGGVEHRDTELTEVIIFNSVRSVPSMTAAAATDIKVLKIMPQEVMDMVSRNPRLAFQLDEVMDMRRKRLEKQFEEMMNEK